ncbi:hypothetical protein NHH03_27080 [Stieleria sp. TO1_6]|uniref:hypothetical protein n=1 Tax=Stieleria tagensis TaxID=2956795 RepID=UPI00209AFB41|nr:hypothetical protein [Stieleria tagensis]MCO8125432.1 hypothetical protein [Stieleria tagensis]
MIIFVVFVILWLVITLLGHLSWVVTASILKFLFSEETPQVQHPRSLRDDADATRRILQQLKFRRKITAKLEQDLLKLVDELVIRGWNNSLQGQTRPATTTNRQSLPAAQAGAPTKNPPPAPKPIARPIARTAALAPVPSQATPAPVSTPTDAASKPVPSQAPPVTARTTFAESLSEFLADHNIRWGELLAGLLIVVCSIGLVVSLWSTLTAAHRIIPSLIFLTGNAAIFGAGLYTLFRWRLQDTSRATLVIATLLVPLGILAGLSTGGIDPTSVALNDPVTVLTILGAGAIYLTLIWHASGALVGRRMAPALTIGIAGPAAVLPLVPAAVRNFDTSAGWIMLAGSAAVWGCIAAMASRRRIARGNAIGRRAMIMGVTGFSLSVLAGYCVFMLRLAPSAWLAVAIATLPGVLALAAGSLAIAGSEKRPTTALLGSVVFAIGLLACGCVLVPAMTSMAWLWAWAVSLSAAALIATYTFRNPCWSLLASLPIGIAVLFSSPAVMNPVLWSEIPVWQRFLGGQPMLAALAVGLVTAGIAVALPVGPHRRRIHWAATGWFTLAIINAAVLTVGPIQLMGNIHPWALSALLGSAVVAIVWLRPGLSVIESRPTWLAAWSGGTIAVTLACWASIAKPVVLGQPFPGIGPSLITLVATALCGLVFAESISGQPKLAVHFRTYSSALFLFAGVLASLTTGPLAVTTLVVCITGWVWIGLCNRDVTHLMLARIFLVIAVVVIGRWQFHDTLLTAQSWRSGLAIWGWALAAWSVVIVIQITNRCLRELKRIPSNSKWHIVHRRSQWYDSNKQAWDNESLGRLIQVSQGMLSIAAVLGFAERLCAVGFGTGAAIDTSIALPVVAIALGGYVLFLGSRLPRQTALQRDSMQHLLVASLLAWIGWQTAVRSFDEPSQQLVLATSILASGCFVLDLFRRRSSAPDLAVAGQHAGKTLLTAFGLGTIGLSSAALLAGGWVPAVADGISPAPLATWAVAVWWSAAAVTALCVGIRQRSLQLTNVAVVLVPAIVILVTPIWLPGQWWVWIQLAAISSGGVALGLRFAIPQRFRPTEPAGTPVLEQPILLSLAICVSLGITTGTGVITSILIGAAYTLPMHQPVGWMLTTLAAGLLWTWPRIVSTQPLVSTQQRDDNPFNWTVLLSLTSGHLTLLLMPWMAAGISPGLLLSTVWLVIAAISLANDCRCVWTEQPVRNWFGTQTAGLAIASSVLCCVQGTTPSHWTVGLLGCVIVAVLATALCLRANDDLTVVGATRLQTIFATRSLCWFALGVGGYFVLRLTEFTAVTSTTTYTALFAWTGVWAILWRMACPDDATSVETVGAKRRLLADGEAALAITICLAAEFMNQLTKAPYQLIHTVDAASQFWIRILVGGLVVGSVCFRFTRRGVSEVSILSSLLLVGLIALRFGVDRELSQPDHITLAGLSIATLFTAMVFSGGSLCQLINATNRYWPGLKRTPQTPPLSLSVPSFASVMIWTSIVPLTLLLGTTGWLLVQYNTHKIVPVAICGVGLLALALAELAERSGRGRLRYVAMTTGLMAIAMLASTNIESSAIPMLTLSTRWFTGWVCIAALLVFALPKLLSRPILQRWHAAIRYGTALSFSLAIGSLITTLIQEGMVRMAGQTETLSTPLVLAAAATLGILSLLSTIGAIFSGPGFSYREAWKLTDLHRSGLVIAAQLFGGLTWFHLFLCKNPLADLGLRAYWPYVVMALSFASVGITEWARRRRDTVLAETLKRTALFLPLVPVIGFWLSGSLVTSFFGNSTSPPWTFIQGRVSYQAVLVAAALYYGVISFLWKSGRARIASIAIGNAALWVILAQTPNWEFLTHPQAWLIPPAICVLIATHFHRQSLGLELTKNIRYAATLTIYVTSTADMLLQGVGSTLMGPILLITLALLGTAAGVAFRIRPFLYLGTTFVFVGVTSMVWHAGRQMDAVWPWWVFGITTGVILLGGLMMIEKNKPQLRRLAKSMQAWET